MKNDIITSDTVVTRAELARYFAVSQRALTPVLKRFEVQTVAGRTTWRSVLAGIGFGDQKVSARFHELVVPLLTAHEVAELLNLKDSSTIYKWCKQPRLSLSGPFPAAINLSRSADGGRMMRWIKFEILAWAGGQKMPAYIRLKATPEAAKIVKKPVIGHSFRRSGGGTRK